MDQRIEQTGSTMEQEKQGLEAIDEELNGIVPCPLLRFAQLLGGTSRCKIENVIAIQT
jgi:hypothetical protein